MGGIELLAGSVGEGLRRRLPGQRKTQREALALLVATMLDVRSANLAWFRIRNFRGLNTALIEDTLDGAKSTRYKHAARHLLECQSLAPGIKDFGTFEESMQDRAWFRICSNQVIRACESAGL